MLSVAGMAELEDDVVALMRKRVYDVCGVLGKTVKVNPDCCTFALAISDLFLRRLWGRAPLHGRSICLQHAAYSSVSKGL